MHKEKCDTKEAAAGKTPAAASDSNSCVIRPIAYMHSSFVTKFGIPRQSGLTDARAEIVFEPEYASPEAFRGIEEFSHLWLIWGFSENTGRWSSTVRPPRLGGNVRMGVFATRSPFRPNNLGLSLVQLEKVEHRSNRCILHVLGADLMDGTPIYDVKPYIPYVDARPEAAGGFTDHTDWQNLEVRFTTEARQEAARSMPEEKLEELRQILELDPRPSYQKDPDRIYGLSFSRWEVHFRADEKILTVLSIEDRI
ncbi:MAG: tRNA (N6-threonylcarbamoyladenosine(37)-N6)-methyltransferase TrmO [Eubacteriales bacterium]|nr:tRNA (N6-threonylcarbamoyladenosine(37)-N6)-methyltransferase TrmO [Eubacteriales bacterium]